MYFCDKNLQLFDKCIMKHNSGIIYRNTLHKVTRAFIFELSKFFILIFFLKLRNVVVSCYYLIELLFFIRNLNVNHIFDQNPSKTNTVIKNVI